MWKKKVAALKYDDEREKRAIQHAIRDTNDMNVRVLTSLVGVPFRYGRHYSSIKNTRWENAIFFVTGLEYDDFGMPTTIRTIDYITGEKSFMTLEEMGGMYEPVPYTEYETMRLAAEEYEKTRKEAEAQAKEKIDVAFEKAKELLELSRLRKKYETPENKDTVVQ